MPALAQLESSRHPFLPLLIVAVIPKFFPDSIVLSAIYGSCVEKFGVVVALLKPNSSRLLPQRNDLLPNLRGSYGTRLASPFPPWRDPDTSKHLGTYLASQRWLRIFRFWSEQGPTCGYSRLNPLPPFLGR